MNPETVHTEAKGDTGESEDAHKAPAPAGDVLKCQRQDPRRGKTSTFCVVYLPVIMLIDNRAALRCYLLMQADMLASSSRRLEQLFYI